MAEGGELARIDAATPRALLRQAIAGRDAALVAQSQERDAFSRAEALGDLVSRTALDIRKVSPSGRAQEHRFNPFWARFSLVRHDEIGITGMAVQAQGETVPIGSFLDPDSRESFATAFSRALATARAR